MATEEFLPVNVVNSEMNTPLQHLVQHHQGQTPLMLTETIIFEKGLQCD